MAQRRTGGTRAGTVTIQELIGLAGPRNREYADLADAIDDFLRVCELSGLAVRTLEWYRDRLTRFWPAAELVTPDTITVPLIRERQIELFHSGIKPQTVNGYLRAVKRLISWAQREEAWPGVERIKLDQLPQLKFDREQQRVLSEEELGWLMTAANTGTIVGRRDVAMIALLADTGIRVSELISLRVEDVNLTPPTITVRASTSKSRRTRILALSNRMAYYMKSWLRQRSRAVPEECDSLFPSTQGWKALDRHSVNHALIRHAAKAGIPGPLGPHCLRRMFATEAIRDGADITGVQQAMGHKTLHMTREYAQLADRDGWDATRKHSPLATMGKKPGNRSEDKFAE